MAAVHAYDESICHRDVKSFNFLGKCFNIWFSILFLKRLFYFLIFFVITVDHQFNVKIADLELGVTDHLAKQSFTGKSSSVSPHNSTPTDTPVISGVIVDDTATTDTPLLQQYPVSISDSDTSTGNLSGHHVQVEQLLPNWMAPEVTLHRIC